MLKNYKYLFLYLEKEKIFMDRSEFEFQIQSHPDYPSLLSISETLSFFKIKNLAIKLQHDDVVHLPSNFIALIQDKNLSSNLTFVEKTKNGYKYLDGDSVIESNEETFQKVFKNIVLLIENEENDVSQPKKSNGALILFYFLLGLGYVTLVFFNGFLILVAMLIFLASVGVYLSVQSISSELGIKTKFSEAVCTISTNADCNAVLNSVKSKIIAKIGFSTVSVAFFCMQIIGVLLFSIFNKQIEFFNIISILSLLSAPVLVFSLYHQTLVAKKWCPICMAIIFVVLFELLTLIVANKFYYAFHPIYFISYSFILVGVFLIVYLIKKSYKTNLELQSTIVQNNRFKRNYSLFKMALQSSQKLKKSVYDSEKIILGDPNSSLRILMVSSPYCGHCKKAHELITDILNRYNNKVCIQFNFNLQLSDANAKQLHFRLVQIYLLFGQNQFLKNLHIWFETNDFSKIDEVSGLLENESRIVEILGNQYNWNQQNDLTFTPAIIVNGFHFPKQYERTDLIYFIDELADDESFNS